MLSSRCSYFALFGPPVRVTFGRQVFQLVPDGKPVDPRRSDNNCNGSSSARARARECCRVAGLKGSSQAASKPALL